MAVTTCSSKDYDKGAKMVDRDSHIASGNNNGDEVQAAAMPRSMTSGRNEGKAAKYGKTTTPAPTIKAERYGK